MPKLNLPPGPQVNSKLIPDTNRVRIVKGKCGKDANKGYAGYWVDEAGELLACRLVKGYFRKLTEEEHATRQSAVNEVRLFYPSSVVIEEEATHTLEGK